jgi:hypothetical protein
LTQLAAVGRPPKVRFHLQPGIVLAVGLIGLHESSDKDQAVEREMVTTTKKSKQKTKQAIATCKILLNQPNNYYMQKQTRA